jgi:eukaryotic-like serine/threonine-protein kinase
MGEQVSAESLEGQVIGGRFKVTKLLGEGGMGYVFKATQTSNNREVALKILKEEYMADEVIRARFLREAEAIAQMNHPNIVTLFDNGLEERLNVLYMAMEYLNGRELSQLINDELPKIDLDRLLSLMIGVCGALGEAHKQNIIHRDLKPENVFIVKDHEGREVPKVLDFGFARLQNATKKLTQFGVAFGTPHYMSPEQAMGQLDITNAADVYAVGVMLFELVTGKVPYDGRNAMEIMTKQVSAEIPPITPRPEVKAPDSLIQLIRQCMAKDPKTRPQDGNALVETLQAIRAGKSTASTAPTARLPANIGGSDTRAPAPNNQMMMIGVGVGVVIIILLLVLILR